MPAPQVHTILHSTPREARTGPMGEPLDGHVSGGSAARHTPASTRSGDESLFEDEIMETWLVLGARPIEGQ